MKQFTEATNLDLTDPTNYPNGQLKDATTTTAKDGTRINKTLLADIRTVFTRALKLTGIVPNGQYDTENSSQLFDALKIAIMGKSDFVECILDSPNAFVAGSPNISARKYGDYIHIYGVYKNNSGGNGFTLPIGLIPALPILSIDSQFRISAGVMRLVNTLVPDVTFVIETDGRVYVPGGSFDDSYFFDCMIPNGITV